MSRLDLRAIFGEGPISLAEMRDLAGLSGSVTVRQIVDAYTSDIVFHGRIVTGSGVYFTGAHAVVLRFDGSYTYSGHFRATGVPSYDIAILATVDFAASSDGAGAPDAGQIVFAAHGRVHGSNEAGDKTYSWGYNGQSPLIRAAWLNIRRSGKLSRRLQHDPDWFGTLGKAAGFLGQILAFGAAFGPTGPAIVLALGAAEHLDLEQLVLSGTVGVIFASGAAYVLGPGYAIPAFFASGAVTAAALRQEPLNDDERKLARSVFGDTLPLDSILKTNLLSPNRRPFTTPTPGGTILLNLGNGFHDSIHYTGGGGDQRGPRAPGQLLIHELTHAWQIHHASFEPEFYCRAISSQLKDRKSAYGYGPAGGSWSSYGTEQQAAIVDQWFAGRKDTRDERPQNAFDPMQQNDGNPYFRYIRDNIRARIT